MSTNVYDYMEQWDSGKKPSRYYGWVIITSSDSMRVAHFEVRKECRELEKAIKKLLPDFMDSVLVTACLAIRRWGEERDYSLATIIMKEEFTDAKVDLTDDLFKELDDVIDKFCRH